MASWPVRRRLARFTLAVLLVSSVGCADAVAPAPTTRPPDAPPPQPTTTDGIFVAGADGSAPVAVVSGARAAWSPDGRRIAFQRTGDVYVVDADGRNETRVSAGKSPNWSPDGRRIVFAGADGITVVNLDGSGARTLIRHDFRDDTYKPWDLGVDKPAWSPDGALIAFEHLGDGDVQPAQAFVMDSSGANPRRVTQLPNGTRYAESDPSWSPDGSKLAYWSYGYGIAVNDRNGGVPTSVHADFSGGVVYGAKPTWRRDGRAIAFNRREPAAPTPCSVWMASLTGLGASLFIPDACDAVWSPDGSRIAFTRKRSGP
jgi:Tol biopolymer transport system component